MCRCRVRAGVVWGCRVRVWVSCAGVVCAGVVCVCTGGGCRVRVCVWGVVCASGVEVRKGSDGKRSKGESSQNRKFCG